MTTALQTAESSIAKAQPARKKRILWSVAGVLCLAFLVFCFVGFDGEAFKEQLVAEVWAQKARKLEIRGALRFKILPRLAVEINDVHLSGPNGEGEFMRMGKLQGALEILPLLTGKFSVNRIEARDFALFAKRNPDGTTNFDDLLAKDETETESAPLDFEIGRLVLLGGRLSWEDAAGGQHYELEEVYLRSDAIGLTAQGRLEMGGKIKDIVFTLDTRYAVNSAAQSLQLDTLHVTLKPPGAEKIRLDWTMRQFTANWGEPALAFADLKLEGSYENHSQETLVATLKLAEFDWRPEGGSAQGGAFEVTWTPHAAMNRQPLFVLDAKLPRLTGEGSNWQGDALEGSFQGNWQKSQLTGKLVLPFAVHARPEGGVRLGMETLTVEAEALGGRLKEALNVRLLGNWETLLPDGASSGKLQLSQADSRLDLDWQLSLPFQLTFKAILNRLNVDRYWTMEAENSGEAAVKAEADEAESLVETQESSSDFPGTLDGTVRIGELIVNGIRIENLESRIGWTDGALAVTPQAKEAVSSEQGVKGGGAEGGKNAASPLLTGI